MAEKNKPVLRDEVMIFVALKAEGYSFAEIGRKMERSPVTIEKHIRGYDKYKEKWFTEMMYKRR